MDGVGAQVSAQGGNKYRYTWSRPRRNTYLPTYLVYILSARCTRHSPLCPTPGVCPSRGRLSHPLPSIHRQGIPLQVHHDARHRAHRGHRKTLRQQCLALPTSVAVRAVANRLSAFDRPRLTGPARRIPSFFNRSSGAHSRASPRKGRGRGPSDRTPWPLARARIRAVVSNPWIGIARDVSFSGSAYRKGKETRPAQTRGHLSVRREHPAASGRGERKKRIRVRAREFEEHSSPRCTKTASKRNTKRVLLFPHLHLCHYLPLPPSPPSSTSTTRTVVRSPASNTVYVRVTLSRRTSASTNIWIHVGSQSVDYLFPVHVDPGHAIVVHRRDNQRVQRMNARSVTVSPSTEEHLCASLYSASPGTCP